MASIIKADNIQKVSDGTNIIKKCGSTITLGSCGATISLACGATQTGFGRTGTVDWCTTAKTAPFTGVSGNGYFVNTTSGVVTVTLPATPSAGDIISIADYASTFQTNNLTICRNSSKINGGCDNATLNIEGQSITLVYVDATRGWKNTMDSTSNVTGIPTYIIATGGTISCCGDYKIHTFTGDDTFTVTSAPTPANNYVDYLVVAGGGGSANNHSGGGGAGGYRESHCATTSGCYTASPLASGTSLPVSIQGYPVTVGSGGLGIPAPQGPGSTPTGNPSTFSTITSSGGGRGGTRTDGVPSLGGNGFSGGSGGGAGGENTPTSAGSGNTPPVSPSQGNSGGGWSSPYCGGGGGGATSSGSTAVDGAPGGNGAGTAINPSPTIGTPGPSPTLRYFAGGGGASRTPDGTLNGGYGGGGHGAYNPSVPLSFLGVANTGGGAGGNACTSTNTFANGGSGIVIIRYKFQ
jgi:hypothetical protein